MKHSLGLISMVVRDYDEAVAFFVVKLGFKLVEDAYIAAQDKRWVVVSPDGGKGAKLLLARATGEAQLIRVGNQTGGRVVLFLNTDDFWRDYELFKSRGVHFVRAPRTESYGTVAVFEDLYGNLGDLIEPAD